MLCLWRVLGSDVQVKAVLAEVEGYSQRFTLVTSALPTVPDAALTEHVWPDGCALTETT